MSVLMHSLLINIECLELNMPSDIPLFSPHTGKGGLDFTGKLPLQLPAEMPENYVNEKLVEVWS